MMTQWRRSTTSMAVAVRSVAQYLRTTSSARRASPQVLGSLTSQYQQENGMRVNYSTTTTSSVPPPPPPPSDPDTHDDFKPTNKSQSSGLSSLKELVEQDVKENPVMIYMKGVPDFPQCGFSSLAVKVLKHHNAPLSARNILEDPELKNAVKAYSLWPTFPQVFIKGEFIGGSDIVLNMHQSGELKEKLKDLVAAPASAKSE